MPISAAPVFPLSLLLIKRVYHNHAVFLIARDPIFQNSVNSLRTEFLLIVRILNLLKRFQAGRGEITVVGIFDFL